MAEVTDVVVLGAGVAGCATAYYLARDGVKVTVVEKDAIGSCASGFALGLLNPLTGRGIPGPVQSIAELGFKMHLDLWPTLKEESGVDFQAHTRPHLEICLTEDEVREQTKEMKRWDATDGFSARWLEPDDLLRLDPRFSRDILGAILLEEVGILDSYSYTLALAQAAEHHGAEIVHGEVVGLKSDGKKATGVKLLNGEIDCDAVVIALGPWSGYVSEWLDFDVAVTPLKGQMIYLEQPDPPLEYHVHGACSFVNKPDGLVWVAATEESVGFDTNLTTNARDYLMERALKIMPDLGKLEMVRQTACLRPITPDAGPIIGAVPGWEGVYLATGAAKQGILLSPAIGRATADLVTKGKTSLPIENFAPDRFATVG